VRHDAVRFRAEDYGLTQRHSLEVVLRSDALLGAILAA